MALEPKGHNCKDVLPVQTFGISQLQTTLSETLVGHSVTNLYVAGYLQTVG
jgi:hypothetical protein